MATTRHGHLNGALRSGISYELSNALLKSANTAKLSIRGIDPETKKADAYERALCALREDLAAVIKDWLPRYAGSTRKPQHLWNDVQVWLGKPDYSGRIAEWIIRVCDGDLTRRRLWELPEWMMPWGDALPSGSAPLSIVTGVVFQQEHNVLLNYLHSAMKHSALVADLEGQRHSSNDATARRPVSVSLSPQEWHEAREWLAGRTVVNPPPPINPVRTSGPMMREALESLAGGDAATLAQSDIVPTSDRGLTTAGSHKVERQCSVSEARAKRIDKYLTELQELKREAGHYSWTTYDEMKRERPTLEVIRLADTHAELKEAISAIAENRQVVWMAMKFVSASTHASLHTLKRDWNRHKPDYRRKGTPQSA